MPQRIQRKRAKGWRMPEGTVYVGRGCAGKPFGNPYRVGGYFRMGPGRGRSGFVWLEAHPSVADATFTKIETAEQAVEWFKEHLKRYPLKDDDLSRIRGKDLACWCRLDQPCHADVLLKIANEN